MGKTIFSLLIFHPVSGSSSIKTHGYLGSFPGLKRL